MTSDPLDNTPSGDSEDTEWVVIGFASDKLTADYIIESLRSYNIPSTLNSKSGYLGDIGMTNVSSLFGAGPGAYEVLVVADRVEEAMGIAEMVAGENWEPIVDGDFAAPIDFDDINIENDSGDDVDIENDDIP